MLSGHICCLENNIDKVVEEREAFLDSSIRKEPMESPQTGDTSGKESYEGLDLVSIIYIIDNETQSKIINNFQVSYLVVKSDGNPHHLHNGINRLNNWV
jgi:hypothetical protein